MKFHPLACEHLKNRKKKITGMPGEVKNSGEGLLDIRQLHNNVNYFADTDYISYPSNENPELAAQFIDFLKFDESLKGAPNGGLSFLTPDHLFFISASEAIDLLIRSFCEPKVDKVCITSPTFPLYEYCAANHNSLIVDVPLKGEIYDEMDVQRILSENPKLTFIASPNNPVGSLVQYENLLALIKNIQGILVIDEAYIEFSTHPSLVNYVDEYNHLVILRSFSKIWGLAGIRCGVVISNPAVIYTLKQMVTPCRFPSHTQRILEDSVAKYRAIVEMRSIVEAERIYLTTSLKHLECIEKIYPSEANFLLIKFFDAQLVYQKLLNAGFLVRNTNDFVKNSLRISLGNHEDNEKLVFVFRSL
jgi:histidinol-phosphate aminotransferase